MNRKRMKTVTLRRNVMTIMKMLTMRKIFPKMSPRYHTKEEFLSAHSRKDLNFIFLKMKNFGEHQGVIP